MCVMMCAPSCLDMWAHLPAVTQTYVLMFARVCMCVYVCVCTYLCFHLYTFICVLPFTSARVGVCARVDRLCVPPCVQTCVAGLYRGGWRHKQKQYLMSLSQPTVSSELSCSQRARTSLHVEQTRRERPQSGAERPTWASSVCVRWSETIAALYIHTTFMPFRLFCNNPDRQLAWCTDLYGLWDVALHISYSLSPFREGKEDFFFFKLQCKG